MSAKKLTITDTTGAVKGSFNIRYEKLDRDEAPVIEHRVGDVIVKNRSIHNGVILLEGMTTKAWVDEQGKEYAKDEIKHYYEGQEVREKAITTTFEISGFQSLSAFTDSYVIDKYYEVSADTDGKTKDFDKEVARQRNLSGMRRLWEHLHTHGLVARGEFNASSAGFKEGDGYIRALSFGNKWGLELSSFKEEKIFQHLQEEIPAETSQTSGTGPILKRIKRV